MSTFFQKLTKILDKNIGRCPRCMRMSFLAAFGTAGVAVMDHIMTTDPIIIGLAWMSAFAWAALWIFHLVVFAARSVQAANAPTPSTVRKFVGAPIVPPVLLRRQFFTAFGKAFAFGAIATALSSSAALACVQPPVPCSTNSDCTCSNCCAGSHCQPSC